ncbi:MAG: glycosyltransferase family 4 protein, partial [Candidatus Hydrothermia bacterium]
LDYKILIHPVNLHPPPRSRQRLARLIAIVTRTPFELTFFRWLVRPEMIKVLRRELDIARPDVIHIHGTFCGGLLADFLNRAGLPWVVHIHSVDSELMRASGHPPDHPIVRLADQLLQKSLESATVAVAVSENLRSRIAELGIDVSKVKVVYNPILMPELHPPVGEKERYVYLPARLSPEKGVDIALRAWAMVEREVPWAHLFIAGTGSHAESLVSLACELGLERVRFLGPLPWQENMAWMAGSLLVLQTTVPRGGFRESYSLVAAEAMTLGKPLISSDTGGAPEIMGDTGLLVPPFDHEALADAVIELLKDNGLREKLGRRARERADSLFDPDLYADRMRGIFSEAIAVVSRGRDAL